MFIQRILPETPGQVVACDTWGSFGTFLDLLKEGLDAPLAALPLSICSQVASYHQRSEHSVHMGAIYM